MIDKDDDLPKNLEWLVKSFSEYALRSITLRKKLGISNGAGVCECCGKREFTNNLLIVERETLQPPSTPEKVVEYLADFEFLHNKAVVCGDCLGVSPLNQDERVCCVYWIRRANHTDIFKEGYVGISVNFTNRLAAHVGEARNNLKKVQEFSKSLMEDDYVASVVLYGSVDYCLSMESALRPHWNIGWNISAGGELTQKKHGLSTHPNFKIMNRLITAQKRRGGNIDPALFTAKGKEDFLNYLDTVSGDGDFVINNASEGLCTGNICRKNRSQILRESGRKYLLNGELFCPVELGEKFGIKPNTITWRLIRGESVEEAVRLVPKKKKSVVVNNRVVVYSGNITQEQIREAEELLVKGITKNSIAVRLGVPPKSLYELFEKGEL